MHKLCALPGPISEISSYAVGLPLCDQSVRVGQLSNNSGFGAAGAGHNDDGMTMGRCRLQGVVGSAGVPSTTRDCRVSESFGDP